MVVVTLVVPVEVVEEAVELVLCVVVDGEVLVELSVFVWFPDAKSSRGVP